MVTSVSFPRFAGIYGIQGSAHGNSIGLYPEDFEMTDLEAVDEEVQAVVDTIKDTGLKQGIAVEDYITIRQGSPLIFEEATNVNREFRVLFTEEDATWFQPLKTILSQFETAILSYLKDKKDLAWDISYTQTEDSMNLQSQRPLWKKIFLTAEQAPIRPELKAREDLLKQTKIALSQQYADTIQPIVQEIGKRIQGCLPVEVAEDRLQIRAFNIKTGEPLKPVGAETKSLFLEPFEDLLNGAPE